MDLNTFREQYIQSRPGLTADNVKQLDAWIKRKQSMLDTQSAQAQTQNLQQGVSSGNLDLTTQQVLQNPELYQQGMKTQEQQQMEARFNSYVDGSVILTEQEAKDHPLEAQAAKSAGVKVMKQSEIDVKKKKEELQAKANALKPELAKKAKAVLDIINKGKAGKLKGKDYEAALHAVSADFAGARAFAEGGKALTVPELSVMAGFIPTIERRDPNIIQKMMGIVPPQTGKVLDDTQTLERKMRAVLKAIEGKPITAEDFKGIGGKEDKSILGFLGNVGGNTKDILNSMLNLPAEAVKVDPKRPSYGNLPLDLLINRGGVEGIANSFNETLGRPLEGGDILGRAGEHAYEKPVDTALWAIPGMQGIKALKGAKAKPSASGETTPSSGSPINRAGGNMRASARGIDVGPNISGPAREAQINKTLDDVGIKGNPAQQYNQLGPKMNEISGKIEKHLDENPKTVSISSIKNDFKLNLADTLRSKNLNSKTAKQEVNGYLIDLHGDKMGTTITTKELFKLKKQVNKDYQGVAKKIDSKTPLNDREKVIAVARKTFDDIIAEKHPQVKKMTLQQSDLFDATESLHKRRTSKAALYPLGIKTPVGPVVTGYRGIQDIIGRGLQKLP